MLSPSVPQTTRDIGFPVSKCVKLSNKDMPDINVDSDV